MADQFSPLIPSSEGDQLTSDSLGGSTFILNNTSYSGADIKVVINVYETEGAKRAQIDEISDEENKAANNIKATKEGISFLESRLASVKSNTPEFQQIIKNIAKNTANQYKLEQTQVALSQKKKILQTGLPLKSTKTLAEVQTLSCSIYRAKNPVRAFGKTYPKSYVRGGRTVGGSLIFAVFDQHVLYEFLEAHASDFDSESHTSALMDQLPPVDITIVFANEYGSISRMALYGVEFVSEGQTMSIEDIFTEEVIHFVARDIDPMRKLATRKLDQNSVLMSEFNEFKASDLIAEEEYQNAKSVLDPFERFRRRQDPFV
jgi:hypothetical protein